MTSTRGCSSSCEHFVKFKGVTARPILFSHLMRHDGEGAINHEELFADDRSLRTSRSASTRTSCTLS